MEDLFKLAKWVKRRLDDDDDDDDDVDDLDGVWIGLGVGTAFLGFMLWIMFWYGLCCFAKKAFILAAENKNTPPEPQIVTEVVYIEGKPVLNKEVEYVAEPVIDSDDANLRETTTTKLKSLCSTDSSSSSSSSSSKKDIKSSSIIMI